jgi:tRNA/tmRNA/rRNA uracil-C5-methylase (TrmA/RlmC/RlmD family)
MTRAGTEFELTVDDVAHGGWCVGRHNGQVVFVRHALPGERVRVRVTERTSNLLRAEAIEVLTPSPDRVEAPCRFAGPGACGGSDWQEFANIKLSDVRNALDLSLHPEVLVIT